MLEWLKEKFARRQPKKDAKRPYILMTPYEMQKAIARIFTIKDSNTFQKAFVCQHCQKTNYIAEEDITVHIEPMFEQFVEHCKAVLTSTSQQLVADYQQNLQTSLRETKELNVKLEYLVNLAKIRHWDIEYYKKALEKAQKLHIGKKKPQKL